MDVTLSTSSLYPDFRPVKSISWDVRFNGTAHGVLQIPKPFRLIVTLGTLLSKKTVCSVPFMRLEQPDINRGNTKKRVVSF